MREKSRILLRAAVIPMLLCSIAAQTQARPSQDLTSLNEALTRHILAYRAAHAHLNRPLPPFRAARGAPGWLVTASLDGKRLRLRSPNGGTYTVFLYFPEGKVNQPLVLLTPLPVSHRKTMLNYCEKTILKRSMACAYLEADASPWEMLDNLNTDDPQASVAALKGFRQNILDTVEAGEVALDALTILPRVDPNRVAAAGFSLGGTMASLMAQKDDRIKSLVLLFSGADLANIVMTKKTGSKKWEAQLSRFRSSLAQATNSEDSDHLKDFLENFLAEVEPMRGVDKMRDLPTFMANPRKDEIIPKTAVEAYRDAMEANGVLLSAYTLPIDFHAPTKLQLLSLIVFHMKSALNLMHRLDSSGDFIEQHLNQAADDLVLSTAP